MINDFDELFEDVEVLKEVGVVNRVEGITDNSQEIKPGFLFVAIKGKHFDGHDFCGDAVRKGASLLVVEDDIDFDIPYVVVPNSRIALSKISSNFYGKPSKDLKTIGVTGTDGKTTTVHLISSMYSGSVSFSTVEYSGLEREIEVLNTTPSPVILNRELADARRRGVDTAVIEVSSIGVEQHRLSHIDFDYAVFLNITRDHLNYHGSFESYREAKAQFFRNLKEDSLSLINADDRNAPYFIESSNSKVVTFGIEKGNIKCEIITDSVEGMRVKVEGLERSIVIESKLIGKFNVYNILAAVSLGFIDSLSDRKIKEGIKNAILPPGRLEKIDVPGDFSVFIDYAHTPQALSSVLLSLKDYNPARIITVFGAGGDRDRGKRSTMGSIVSEISDISIVTSDNPRYEDPERIIEDIIEGIGGNNTLRISDREKAIKKALEVAEKDDFVLIAGKGHEEYQEIEGEKIPFSDKACVKEYFRK